MVFLEIFSFIVVVFKADYIQICPSAKKHTEPDLEVMCEMNPCIVRSIVNKSVELGFVPWEPYFQLKWRRLARTRHNVALGVKRMMAFNLVPDYRQLWDWTTIGSHGSMPRVNRRILLPNVTGVKPLVIRIMEISSLVGVFSCPCNLHKLTVNSSICWINKNTHIGRVMRTIQVATFYGWPYLICSINQSKQSVYTGQLFCGLPVSIYMC